MSRPAPMRLALPVIAPIARVAVVVSVAAAMVCVTGIDRIARADPVTGSTGNTSPARVHVRGAARIDAHASRASGRLVLRGILTDDSGAPLGDQTVGVTLSDGPAELGEQGNGATTPQACMFGQSPSPHPAGSRGFWLPLDGHKALVPTDAGGQFCIQAAMPMGRYVAHLDWRGSTWLDAARADVPVDLALKPVAIWFAPEPGVVRVDDELTLDLDATIEEEGAREAASGITVAVTDERGARMAEAVTDDTGHATFAVEAAKLGPPGKGELRATFDGTSQMGKAVHVTPIERRARVVLHAVGPELPAVDADEAASFSVSVRTSRGAPVPTGSVEVLVGNLVLSAATVEAGEAHLVVSIGSVTSTSTSTSASTSTSTSAGAGASSVPPQSIVPLRVRYAPDAPWYTSGDELSLSLPVRAPSPWRRTPLLLAGLAVIAWLIVGRRSRTRLAPRDDTEPGKVPSVGEARIDVLRSVKTSRAGWTGRVVDAHDETPIAGAEVSVERPSFKGVAVVASAHANPGGRFELRCEDMQPGDALAVQAPLHAMLRKPVPPFGEIQIALVLRRRKLLGRLVAWARAKGRPFDQYPEPTPGHVKRAAGTDVETARWAQALERAAFGAEEVDDAAEKAVLQLEPRPATAQPPAPSPPGKPERARNR